MISGMFPEGLGSRRQGYGFCRSNPYAGPSVCEGGLHGSGEIEPYPGRKHPQGTISWQRIDSIVARWRACEKMGPGKGRHALSPPKPHRRRAQTALIGEGGNRLQPKAGASGRLVLAFRAPPCPREGLSPPDV
jgi:hypothetical protein